VTNGTKLSATTAARLVGSYGMQILVDDNNGRYVTDDSPSTESRYRARFYLDPNSISMAKNDTHYVFTALNASGTVVLRIELRRGNNGYQIQAGVADDAAVFTTTSYFSISDAPHAIEIDWRAATAAGANNGVLTLWIDGVQRSNLTTIDNDTRRVDSARLGAVSGVDTDTRGTYYLDAFVSRRSTYIGP
jgi:hypothetical protein